MSFRDFVEEARLLVSEAIRASGYPMPEKLEWDEPPSETLGDVSFRVGYQLAKPLKKRPGEVASELALKIESTLSFKKRLVERVEGHPSGFLNFTFNRKNFFFEVLLGSVKEDYGRIDLGHGKQVLVEHTAVNPNKALHIGHLRNVAVGDCVSRILSFTNHRVGVLNYIDDSGLQVADIVVGLLYLNYAKEAPIGVKYDHYAGDEIYVNVNRQYELDEKLKQRQKYVLKAIEDHDPTTFPLAAEVTDRILKEQLKTCWRFGAYYDLLAYESDIIGTKLWEHVFSQLKEKGIVRLETQGKFENCWIVTVPGEREGEDKVLVRSDGTATYVAKDTPFAALKTGLTEDRFAYSKYLMQPNGKQLWRTRADAGETRKPPTGWGVELSITVIDARQARLQRIIQFILEQLAGADLKERYVHLGYAIISLSARTASALSTVGKDDTQKEISGEEIVTMSGRKGTYINVDDVFDAVKQKALEETRKRNPSVTDSQWLGEVSEKLALSALRFSLLKQDLEKIIVFDMEESLQLIGETGPYMLYTFARASSIISKTSPEDLSAKPTGGLLNSETEIALLKLISKFDIAVEKSVKMLAPKWIAHYSFELCEAFNKFYEKHRVLQEENREIRAARIQAVLAFRSVLGKSLGLLGIEPLPKI